MKKLSGANSDRTILEDERGRFVRCIHELKPRPCGEVFYSTARPTLSIPRIFPEPLNKHCLSVALLFFPATSILSKVGGWGAHPERNRRGIPMSYAIPTATTTDLHFHLKCRHCGAQTPFQAAYVCEECYGPLEVSYDYAFLRDTLSQEHVGKGPRTLWRYRPLLPVADGIKPVDIGTGGTPLIHAERLGERLGLRELYIKNDAVNPTYSFKDRAVSVATTVARQLGFKTIACASTGNLAGSVAAHAARAGLDSYVFIPADLEEAKILGAAVYGTNVSQFKVIMVMGIASVRW